MKKKPVVKIDVPKNQMQASESLKILWQNRLDEEVTEKRKADLEKVLDAIPDIEEKKNYLKLEIIKYQQSLPASIRADSGLIQKELNCEWLLFWDNYLNDELRKLQVKKGEKKSVVTAPAVALFAQIVNSSGIIPYYEEEYNRTTYCQRVIDYFKINNVTAEKCRQAFKIHEPDLKQSDRNFQIVINSILPKLTGTDKEKIQKYIDSKIKLYG